MTRVIVLMIALSCSAWGQTIAAQKAFMRHVNALIKAKPDTPPIDGVPVIQEEFGLTAESAEAVIATARAYDKEADRLEASMRRSILTRRLQIAGDFQVTYSSELDVVNWVNLDLNLFLLEQMEDLAERLGEDEYAKVAQFMDWRGRLLNIPAQGAWTKSPEGFWRESIKEPLTRPEAEELFARNFKDASLPPADVVPFLEGTVVTVAQGDERGRWVLLSMQEGSSPEVALLIDGKEWQLKDVPRRGEVVRFSGTAIEFSREPFMILFRPERITGMVVESIGPNLPFTVPGLAR